MCWSTGYPKFFTTSLYSQDVYWIRWASNAGLIQRLSLLRRLTGMYIFDSYISNSPGHTASLLSELLWRWEANNFSKIAAHLAGLTGRTDASISNQLRSENRLYCDLLYTNVMKSHNPIFMDYCKVCTLNGWKIRSAASMDSLYGNCLLMPTWLIRSHLGQSLCNKNCQESAASPAHPSRRHSDYLRNRHAYRQINPTQIIAYAEKAPRCYARIPGTFTFTGWRSSSKTGQTWNMKPRPPAQGVRHIRRKHPSISPILSCSSSTLAVFIRSLFCPNFFMPVCIVFCVELQHSTIYAGISSYLSHITILASVSS
jgi:hypothetical protein